MHYELQDALGYRMDQNAPFNPTYSIANLPVARLPINPTAPVPSNALLVPGGVQPDMSMPTLISYTLGIEQALTPNTTLTLRYVGSHGYHEVVGVDANTPHPTICPASPGAATQLRSNGMRRGEGTGSTPATSTTSSSGISSR